MPSEKELLKRQEQALIDACGGVDHVSDVLTELVGSCDEKSKNEFINSIRDAEESECQTYRVELVKNKPSVMGGANFYHKRNNRRKKNG